MVKEKSEIFKVIRYICLSVTLVFGLMTIVGTGGDGDGDDDGCVDVTGTWETTEVVNATDCGEGTYTQYPTYTVTQDGCNITIMPSTGGSYSGTVNGSQINWSGSWEEDGGTTTANISLTISGNNLSGSASWTWSDGYDPCSGTTQITGTRSVASVRFYNDVTCGDSYFTATLDVCGASLNSESGSWSSCKTVSPGTCSWSLSTEPTNCSEISLSGSISLDSDCVYNFLLSYEDPNIELGYTKSCPGQCSTATPWSAVASLKSLSDDDSFELLMEIPFEGEGLTTAQ